MDEADLEGLAIEACEESGLDDRPRCDPRTMAASYLQLTLAPWPGTSPRLVRGVLWYPSDVPEDAQAYYVAHEVGHALLGSPHGLGEVEIERGASRIGSAILLPRRAYLRDLSAVGRDLDALCALWPLASAWVQARRITEVLRDVAASRWLGGRLVSHTGAPVDDGVVWTSGDERIVIADL